MRVSEDLNLALHRLFDRDPLAYLIGEDIADPYGGAFKVTRGLSTRFPSRVLATPISEAGFTGVAAGLALCGDHPIVEVMFADFLTLGFDQLVNFATKSVAMYGRPVAMRMVVRCATGGHRGYGPTHSQSPQKHFIGVPHLSLFELSPFHDNGGVLDRMLAAGHPCLFFEDKVLYTRQVHRGGTVDDLFRFDFLDAEENYARAYVEDASTAHAVVIAPGGVAARALAAARALFLRTERSAQVVVPSRLYPFDPAPLAALLERADVVCVVEDSTAGGTWGAEVAQRLYDLLWGRLRRRVLLLSSADEVIPTAPHLERRVLLQEEDIYRAIEAATRGG